ncbi:hypothetical protein M5689_018813 [Euphorbia peplus]|nr:hypothetical protein M5689_018813 [Euphorbia peplus]
MKDYKSGDQITQNADIFSFGVVVLQLIMKVSAYEVNQDGIKERKQKVKHIVTNETHAYTTYKHDVQKDLREKSSQKEAQAITELALDCTSENSSARPRK